MTIDRLPSQHALLALAAVRDKAMAAETLNALSFSIANDLYPLMPYRQALVFSLKEGGGKPSLLCVSGLARPAEDSPYLVWLRDAASWASGQLTDAPSLWLAREEAELPPDIAEGWSEWWPEGVLCVPMRRKNGELMGMVLFLMEERPGDDVLGLMQGVWQCWAYCWASLARPTRRHFLRSRKRMLAGVALVIALLMLVPVRQSALAPAEIVSRQAQVISAPLDGVIAQMHVRPNEKVPAGAPLFSLDETTLRNRAEVLMQEVVVADAELLSASQRAFDNPQSKSELALLGGRAQQRRAELAAVQAQLQRAHVKAPADGVAVFSDPNDWIGKPVSTGERIMLLADPGDLAMRIELPVADAIALDEGAAVTLFLTAYPLSPLEGEVLETSYQARTTGDGVAAYRLTASIEDAQPHARLGLHGTAKLYGGRVVLGYYLFRRPVAALRAWSGW